MTVASINYYRNPYLNIPQTGNMTNPNTGNKPVYDYSCKEKGTPLPKNARVFLKFDTKLMLGRRLEIDLNSPEVTSKFKNSINNTITIGRNGDVRILPEHTEVSRQHLILQKTDSGYIVEDISKNGTYISDNGININSFFRYWGNQGKEINDKYIKTSKEVHSYLSSAIDRGEYARDFESYKNVINEAHKLAYCGASGKDFWYKKDGEYLSINPYSIEIRPYGSCNNYAMMAKKVEEIAKLYNDPYNTNSDNIFYVKLYGISPAGLPKNKNTMHMYPSSDYTEEYLKQMYRTAKETINLINNGADKMQILYKIAEHYQYCANARPYKQINNSLFMNEVNTLLKKAGMNTMTQGILDHAAQRMQTETFKQYFAHSYLKNQIR